MPKAHYPPRLTILYLCSKNIFDFIQPDCNMLKSVIASAEKYSDFKVQPPKEECEVEDQDDDVSLILCVFYDQQMISASKHHKVPANRDSCFQVKTTLYLTDATPFNYRPSLKYRTTISSMTFQELGLLLNIAVVSLSQAPRQGLVHHHRQGQFALKLDGFIFHFLITFAEEELCAAFMGSKEKTRSIELIDSYKKYKSTVVLSSARTLSECISVKTNCKLWIRKGSLGESLGFLYNKQN